MAPVSVSAVRRMHFQPAIHPRCGKNPKSGAWVMDLAYFVRRSQNAESIVGGVGTASRAIALFSGLSFSDRPRIVADSPLGDC